MQQSPEPMAPSSGWGHVNESQQSAEETSGGGGWGSGWGGGDTNQGWGTDETGNTNTGWGGTETSGEGWGSGGGWGSSVNDSGSGGGGWGSSGKNDDTTATTQPSAQEEIAKPNPPAQTSWGGGWGSSGTTWGAPSDVQDSSANTWGSSANASGSGDGGWGSSGKSSNTADTTQPTKRVETTKTGPPVQPSSDSGWGSSGNTWDAPNDTQGSSADTWGSSGGTWGSSGWGSSNNTWASSNETPRDEPVSSDKGKGKGRENSTQGGGWSGWRRTSNSETTTDPLPSGGMGWGNSTPSIPATADVTQGNNLESIRYVSFLFYRHYTQNGALT